MKHIGLGRAAIAVSLLVACTPVDPVESESGVISTRSSSLTTVYLSEDFSSGEDFSNYLANDLLAARNAVAPQARAFVALCHYDEAGDAYILLRVPDAGRAVDVHLRHGDGFPGEAVPGGDGAVFDASCAFEGNEGPDPEARVFALAYSSNEELERPELDPATSRLVAKLLDANGDGEPSSGDDVDNLARRADRHARWRAPRP